MANHLTLGIYGNGDFVYNVVRDEDLEFHITYNKMWRPGRLLYVDGKRVHNGCLKEYALPKYDKIAEDFYKNNHVNMFQPTVPYQ